MQSSTSMDGWTNVPFPTWPNLTNARTDAMLDISTSKIKLANNELCDTIQLQKLHLFLLMSYFSYNTLSLFVHASLNH